MAAGRAWRCENFLHAVKRPMSIPPWRSFPPRRYAGMVLSIRVKRPQSTAARCWNVAQDMLSPIVVFTLIALKLTGVITWSWWWVLSPVWISAAVLALLVTGLVMLFLVFRCLAMWQQRRPPAEIWLWPVSGVQSQDASGGDLGLQDGHG